MCQLCNAQHVLPTIPVGAPYLILFPNFSNRIWMKLFCNLILVPFLFSEGNILLFLVLIGRPKQSLAGFVTCNTSRSICVDEYAQTECTWCKKQSVLYFLVVNSATFVVFLSFTSNNYTWKLLEINNSTRWAMNYSMV